MIHGNVSTSVVLVSTVGLEVHSFLARRTSRTFGGNSDSSSITTALPRWTCGTRLERERDESRTLRCRGPFSQLTYLKWCSAKFAKCLDCGLYQQDPFSSNGCNSSFARAWRTHQLTCPRDPHFPVFVFRFVQNVTYEDIARSHVKFIIELDHGFSSPDHEDQLDRVKPAL